MKFNTKHLRIDKSGGEVNKGPCKVDTAGYVSAEKRITSLMLAGQRLMMIRREMFDDPDGKVDDMPVHPLRDRGLDLAEVGELQRTVNARVIARMKEREQAALEASQAAQDASGKVSDGKVAP